MHDRVRQIGNMLCVNGMPVADFRLQKNGTERRFEDFSHYDLWICGDIIYSNIEPVADIRASARPFEREALILWLEPWRRRLDTFGDPTWAGAAGLLHQSHFTADTPVSMGLGAVAPA